MSPQFEWQVSVESARQDALIKTSEPRPPRRRKVIVGLMILLGISLGVVYSSIPEPSTPIPTVMPVPPIADTIDREARALAQGRLQAFMSIQDPNDFQWRNSQLTNFKAWGSPPDYSDLYTVVESGTLPNGHKWADINQARDDQFFRETRFYRLQNNQWMRIAPDLSLWGEEQTTQTAHFDLVYREGDAYFAGIVAQHYEEAYRKLCIDLGCDTNFDGSFPRVLTMTLIFRPDESRAGAQANQQYTFTLTSPRLTGLYFQTLYYSAPGRDEPIEREAYQDLLFLTAWIASGDVGHWSQTSSDGFIFVLSAAQWEAARLPLTRDLVQAVDPALLVGDNYIPLDELWVWPAEPSTRTGQLISNEALAMIHFIDETYGPETVVEFLHALGYAQSLPHAIEITGLPYGDFEAKWLKWIKQLQVQ
jgi:hypothetical protein